MIQQTKLEVTNLSGGVTENFIPGLPHMYALADNLWITRDLGLETRWGSRLLEDNGAQIPNGNTRINELFPAINETEMLAVSAATLFYQAADLTWTPLLGPASSQAFVGNLDTNHVAHAEWRSQIFLVPDNLVSGPQKVYRDETGAIQLRQAGLPIPAFPAITDNDRFNACVTLAVAMRTAMLTHFAEAGPFASANTHVTAQSPAALSALTTPTTNAQLAAYINTLRTEFSSHVADAQKYEGGSITGRVYHLKAQFIPYLTQGLLGVLNIGLDTTLGTLDPTSTGFLIAAAKSLNDLKRKYNFHTYATVTHGNAWIPSYWIDATLSTTFGLPILPRNTTGFGRNKVTSPDVSTSSSTFTASNLWGDLVNFVTALEAEMNAHQTGYSSSTAFPRLHTYPDYDLVPFLDPAVDIFDVVVHASILEFLYWLHWDDSNSSSHSWLAFTGTSTTSSNTLTSTSIAGTGAAGSFIIDLVFLAGVWQQGSLFGGARRADITGGTANTIVLDRTASVGYTGQLFIKTNSRYHYMADASFASQTSPTLFTARLALLDYSLSSITSLVTEMQSIAGLIKAHETSFRTGVTYPGPTPGTTATVYSVTTSGHYGVAGQTPLGPVHYDQFAYPMISYIANATYSSSIFDTPPTAATYLYTVVYRYPYKVGSISFEDDSTPAVSSQVFKVVSPAAVAPNTGLLYPSTLTNIPVLSNTANTNYDAANIKVDIYRTIANGTTFYLVGTVNNGTTTFVDNVPDSTLITNQQLYTTGGTVGNDPPPVSKYITILNNTAYYGNIVEGSQALPYRVRQSIQNDPDSCPATFYDDLDDEITGLSNFRNYVIAFCKNSLYRLENGFNELGQGFISHERLTDTVGCVSHASIVRTEVGVFFCGTNGIYWTDGYTFMRLTKELEATYASLIVSDLQRNRINGVYLEDQRRVIWNFVSRADAQDCNISWVLDLNFDFSKGQGSFTTLSGGDSWAPSAMCLFEGRWIRGDARGYVFAHESQWKSDLVVDTTTPSSLWRLQPIIYDFNSCADNFGTNKYKKWATRVTVQAENMGNLSLSVQHKNDNNVRGFIEMVPIRYRKNQVWGNPTLLWNDSAANPNPCLWGFEGMVDDYRRFNAGMLRCDWKAIRMTNADTVICNSDTYGLCDVSADVAGVVTITLLGTAGWKFPLNAAKNYSIKIDDGTGTYLGPFAITTRPDDTHLEIAYEATVPVSQSNRKWMITGIPLDERLKLNSYNITYSPLSDEQRAYHGFSSTDGGGNK